MKVLVATSETQKQRANDFCNVPEGEFVRFGSECDGGSVDDHCGCHRALCGMECHLSTTTMKVVDRTDLTPERFEDAVLASLVAGGWGKADDPRTRDWARQEAEELLRLAAFFRVDTIVERRGKKYQERLPKATQK